jgi:hypothetical protein
LPTTELVGGLVSKRRNLQQFPMILTRRLFTSPHRGEVKK